MIHLYLIRHTTAADSAPSDARRPLTLQGEAEARTVGVMLAALGVRPAYVCASPLLRARQTAALLAKEVQYTGEIETLDELENHIPTEDLLAALRSLLNAQSSQLPASLLLVGHMPSLADHVAALIGEAESGQNLGFNKGSVACVEMPILQMGAGRLLWLKHLRDQ